VTARPFTVIETVVMGLPPKGRGRRRIVLGLTTRRLLAPRLRQGIERQAVRNLEPV
jgi:hypothetical protein